MKKKLISLVLALALVISSVLVLVACNTTLPSVSDEVIAAAEKMTDAQLLEEAKKETGDFVAYGNTSRITDAMKNFIATDYGKALGLTSSNAMAVKKSDSEIYDLLGNEAKAKSASGNASMVLIQDSASLDLERTAKDPLVKNYVSEQFKSQVDEKNRLPLAHQFINKLFMYNVSDKENTAQFSNVWELTDAKYAGNIFFKNPKDEQVNMNFLIMLTKKEWSDKLEAAYKKLHNNEAATDVGAGKTYENYGYKWIAEFIANCNFSITSDTTIAGTLSKADNKGKMGLFVLSKLRDASVYGDNLQVSAWDEDADKNLVKIDPFAGFMYSIYAQLAAKGPRPYTAMLFINYLMTAEGFTPWKSLGGYSANKDVPVFDGTLSVPVELTAEQKALGGDNGKSKDGFVYTDNNKAEMKYVKSEKKTIDGEEVTIKTYMYLADGKTVTDINPETGKANKVGEKDFKASIKTKTLEHGVTDKPLSFWTENLVVEDGAYILSVKANAQDWINTQLSKNTTVKK